MFLGYDEKYEEGEEVIDEEPFQNIFNNIDEEMERTNMVLEYDERFDEDYDENTALVKNPRRAIKLKGVLFQKPIIPINPYRIFDFHSYNIKRNGARIPVLDVDLEDIVNNPLPQRLLQWTPQYQTKGIVLEPSSGDETDYSDDGFNRQQIDARKIVNFDWYEALETMGKIEKEIDDIINIENMSHEELNQLSDEQLNQLYEKYQDSEEDVKMGDITDSFNYGYSRDRDIGYDTEDVEYVLPKLMNKLKGIEEEKQVIVNKPEEKKVSSNNIEEPVMKWNEFMAKHRKQGKSMKEVGRMWRSYKAQNPELFKKLKKVFKNKDVKKIEEPEEYVDMMENLNIFPFTQMSKKSRKKLRKEFTDDVYESPPEYDETDFPDINLPKRNIPLINQNPEYQELKRDTTKELDKLKALREYEQKMENQRRENEIKMMETQNMKDMKNMIEQNNRIEKMLKDIQDAKEEKVNNVSSRVIDKTLKKVKDTILTNKIKFKTQPKTKTMTKTKTQPKPKTKTKTMTKTKTKTKTKKQPKSKTMTKTKTAKPKSNMSYVQAVKEWNRLNIKGSYCNPRKGSEEQKEVLKIMYGGDKAPVHFKKTTKPKTATKPKTTINIPKTTKPKITATKPEPTTDTKLTYKMKLKNNIDDTYKKIQNHISKIEKKYPNFRTDNSQYSKVSVELGKYFNGNSKAVKDYINVKIKHEKSTTPMTITSGESDKSMEKRFREGLYERWWRNNPRPPTKRKPKPKPTKREIEGKWLKDMEAKIYHERLMESEGLTLTQEGKKLLKEIDYLIKERKTKPKPKPTPKPKPKPKTTQSNWILKNKKVVDDYKKNIKNLIYKTKGINKLKNLLYSKLEPQTQKAKQQLYDGNDKKLLSNRMKNLRELRKLQKGYLSELRTLIELMDGSENIKTPNIPLRVESQLNLLDLNPIRRR